MFCYDTKLDTRCCLVATKLSCSVNFYPSKLALLGLIMSTECTRVFFFVLPWEEVALGRSFHECILLTIFRTLSKSMFVSFTVRYSSFIISHACCAARSD